jgi:pyruvate formate lyase activating enzyme
LRNGLNLSLQCFQKKVKVQGLLFDIRRYSVHDGPGIRTTVFFKGCPLNCLWCHNPEGISGEPQTIRRKRPLNGDQAVVEETVGKYFTSREVMNQLKRDLLFFEESGGGVTFSGGEPLQQPEFLKEMVVLCREAGIHTAVDTSGYALEEVFREVAGLTDMLLFDLKTTDNKVHEAYTGIGNALILKNLQSLKGKGPEVVVRIPVIPGVNHRPEDMQAIRKAIQDSGARIEAINLLPYHRLGRKKYEALGMQEPPAFGPEITSDQIKTLMKIFEKAGFETKLGG